MKNNDLFKIQLYSGSLLNNDILNLYPKKVIEKSPNKNWGELIEVTIPLNDLSKIQALMVKHYEGPEPWYLNGCGVNESKKILCAFGKDDGNNGKIFVFDSENLMEYTKILQYGLSKNIPFKVMDFMEIIPKLTERIYTDLQNKYDKNYQKDSLRFFKEPVKILGVRSPIVKKILREYLPVIKLLDKNKIYDICEELFSLGFSETTSVALDILHMTKNQVQSDFNVYELWLKKYISNWGNCDDFCTHAFGELIFNYPEYLSKTKFWAESKNRWFRRASAVVLIYSLRKGKYLKNAFDTADILLKDNDDLVQKGYGWMLKEAGNIYQKEVFGYVMKNKFSMPRTALRYAVEKMPEKIKKEVMEKNLPPNRAKLGVPLKAERKT